MTRRGPRRRSANCAGVVERITYQNPENGYTVARLAPERPGPEARGRPGRRPAGHRRRHAGRPDPRRGDRRARLVAERPQARLAVPGGRLPHGAAGHAPGDEEVPRAAGWSRASGRSTPGRIVDAFGEATFEVIDADPSRLTEVPGIGPIRASRIAATWAEQRHIREVMAALQGYGISTSLAVRIYKKFGDDSGTVIAEEPYRLAREVWGIGFKTADKIARAVGHRPDAPERLQAGVLHALGDGGRRRATRCCPSGRSDRAGGRRCSAVEQRGDRGGGGRAAGDGDVVAATVEDGDDRLASRWRRSRGPSPGWPPACTRWPGRRAADAARLASSAAVDWDGGLRLAGRPARPDARARAGGRRAHGADPPVSILTGGPGTGKTHTLRAVLTLARAKGLRCLLAAPTGRAAKRMEEATGLPCGDAAPRAGAAARRQGGTRRRQPAGGRPGRRGRGQHAGRRCSPTSWSRRSRAGPTCCWSAIRTSSRAWARATCWPTCSAPSGSRSRGWSTSSARARARASPRTPGGSTPARCRASAATSRDCFFLPAEDPAAAAQHRGRARGRAAARDATASGAARSRCCRRCTGARPASGRSTRCSRSGSIPGARGMPEARGGGRVLPPRRPGAPARERLRPGGLQRRPRHGARRSTRPSRSCCCELDDGREVRYPYASLFALTHAYAISVHKAQGAEFPAVVIPLVTSHAPMLGRTLLYTALTRARQLVVIVGQQKALYLAVRDWRREPAAHRAGRAARRHRSVRLAPSNGSWRRGNGGGGRERPGRA